MRASENSGNGRGFLFVATAQAVVHLMGSGLLSLAVWLLGWCKLSVVLSTGAVQTCLHKHQRVRGQFVLCEIGAVPLPLLSITSQTFPSAGEGDVG